MKKIIFILLILLSYKIVILAQNEEQKRKVNRVLIMPYDRYAHYPYSNDLIREFLQIGFIQKGFAIVNDDTTWSIILSKDFYLCNLSDDQADSLSSEVKADLIVYGYWDNYSSTRTVGFSDSRLMLKPVLIKVFDTKKKSVVYHDRINFIERWGLFHKQLDLVAFGEAVAQQVKNLGY